MRRRTFLKSGVGASAGLLLGSLPSTLRPAAAEARWRTFEVATRIEVTHPSGVTRAWVPVPLQQDTDWQRRRGKDVWSGNARFSEPLHDPTYDVGLVYAEWPAEVKNPVIEVTSRIATRDRFVDVTRPAARPAGEDPAMLTRYLQASSLIPVDGIVAETSRNIVKGQRTEVGKARAIYDWIVENTFRDPKVRGCGLGDIKTLLETRYFGGKCADLNALYVGFARAAGLPAREVYGVRVADSARFKALGKSGDITKAQHCRAEVFLTGYGWVPVDPADVRKVILEETPGLTLADPIVQLARVKLFGAWEMNYIAYNFGHDVVLPNSPGKPLGFLMYPQAETAMGRKDSLDPVTFKYRITSKELTA